MKSPKRTEAENRNKIYQSLSPEQKLQHLDSQLGVNVGAVKQRARIQAVIVAGVKK